MVLVVAIDDLPKPSTDLARAMMLAAALVSSPDSLAGILLRGSVLAGDRRRVRYGRLRKAVADGLEEPGVLSAKQPKRRIINLPRSNDGVEPQLPEDVAGRLLNLRTPRVKDEAPSAEAEQEE